MNKCLIPLGEFESPALSFRITTLTRCQKIDSLVPLVNSEVANLKKLYKFNGGSLLNKHGVRKKYGKTLKPIRPRPEIQALALAF